MVAWNQKHNNNLIFFRVSLNILNTPNMVISDGNARSKRTQFRIFTQIKDLDILDPSAINTVRYASNEERKRKKQAEILVPDFLNFSKVLDIICYSEQTQDLIVKLLGQFGIKRPVRVNPGWYF